MKDLRHFGTISGMPDKTALEGLYKLFVPKQTAQLVFESVRDAVVQINHRCHESLNIEPGLSFEDLAQENVLRIRASIARLQPLCQIASPNLQNISITLSSLVKIAESLEHLIPEPQLSVAPTPRRLIHVDKEKAEITIDIQDWGNLHQKIAHDSGMDIPVPIPQFGETHFNEIIRMALRGERPVSLFLQGNTRNFTYFHGYINQTALDSYVHDVAHLYAFASYGGTEYLKAAGLFAYRASEVVAQLGFTREKKVPLEEQLIDILEGCTLCQSFTPVKSDQVKPGVQAVVEDAFKYALHHLPEEEQKCFIAALTASLRSCPSASKLWDG